MPFIKLLGPVTFGASTVEAGEVINLSELSAAALVKEGNAVYEEATEDPTSDEKVEEDPTVLTEVEEAQEGATEVVEGTETEEDRLRSALSAKFKRDDLAKAAKDIGVEFTYDAKKSVIVEAVIEAEKAEALLRG